VRLSHAQERLWFLDQLEPGRPIYNVHFAFRLEGELDAQALERSLDEVVRRHESLRTTFQATETGTVQVVHPSGLHALSHVDLRSTGEDGRQAELLRLATAEAHRPFDLGAGPLLRAVVYRLGEREHVLLVVMHHIVTDGWSAGLFTRELSILYEAFRAGRPSPLPELALQYADFAEWQRNWLDGEVIATQLAYWKKKLAGRLPDLDLPTDRPRPLGSVHRGAGAALDIPRELSEGVRSLCRQEEVTPFMLLFAAFAAWLHRLTRQDDIVVGAPIANRNRVEVEDLIGFFVNTLVLRADCSGDPSFREFLRRMRETALEAFAHQDLPLEALVEALQPRRVPGRSPFFQVLFAFQSGPKIEAVKLPGLEAGPLSLATETSRLDLTFYVDENEDGLMVLVEYDTDLFDASPSTDSSVTGGRCSRGSSPIRRGASPSCRCSRRSSGGELSTGHARRQRTRKQAASRRSSSARSSALRTRSRSSAGTSGSRTTSSRSARKPSQTTSSPSARARMRWSASPRGARSSSWRGSSAYSARAPPTSRSIPTIRASASP
jgi:hypothetical protein